MNYLACYDIADPRRLRRTAKVMERYGIRVQYSFFEMSISEEKLEAMIREIKQEIDLKEDKFYLYPICVDCKQKVIIDGTGEMLSLERFIIL